MKMNKLETELKETKSKLKSAKTKMLLLRAEKEKCQLELVKEKKRTREKEELIRDMEAENYWETSLEGAIEYIEAHACSEQGLAPEPLGFRSPAAG